MNKEEISTTNNMTVTPIRVVTMSNPSVTTLDSPPQMKTVSSRLSNFSVASLLADNRSVKTSLSPTVNHHNERERKSNNNVIISSSNHNHISARLSPSSNNNNNDQFCPSPKNYSVSHANSCSPTVQSNNENNDSNNSISIRNADSDLLERDRRSQTQTPHSSIASDEYDDSIHDDEDDEDVDIEDVNSENSTNEKRPSLNSSMPHQSLIGGPVPLRPTPFSALAAAAAAWGGMSANGVPGWPSRQMPPFGPHGLPFPGQFSGQLNGGKLNYLFCFDCFEYLLIIICFFLIFK
jgi:homeobox protein MSX